MKGKCHWQDNNKPENQQENGRSCQMQEMVGSKSTPPCIGHPGEGRKDGTNHEPVLWKPHQQWDIQVGNNPAINHLRNYTHEWARIGNGANQCLCPRQVPADCCVSKTNGMIIWKPKNWKEKPNNKDSRQREGATKTRGTGEKGMHYKRTIWMIVACFVGSRIKLAGRDKGPSQKPPPKPQQSTTPSHPCNK